MQKLHRVQSRRIAGEKGGLPPLTMKCNAHTPVCGCHSSTSGRWRPSWNALGHSWSDKTSSSTSTVATVIKTAMYTMPWSFLCILKSQDFSQNPPKVPVSLGRGVGETSSPALHFSRQHLPAGMEWDKKCLSWRESPRLRNAIQFNTCKLKSLLKVCTSRVFVFLAGCSCD